MITLSPITEPAKLEEYFKFRYRIYSESRNRVFLDPDQKGFDRDVHDDRAMHFGWYVKEELVGCERMIPIARVEDMYQLETIPDPMDRSAVTSHIHGLLDEGTSIIESSRTCLKREFRSMSNARDLVIAIVRTAHEYGYDHGLFTCDYSQAGFYRWMGLEIIEGTAPYPIKDSGLTKCVIHGTYSGIMQRDLELRNRKSKTRSSRPNSTSLHILTTQPKVRAGA
ncbi:MAG: GNAT family N-acyltransferase [Flavobacteriales bacterium]